VIRLVALLLVALQWPQFRGPEGNGVAAGGGLPIEWSESRNVRWKTAIHGRAWSSPVILGSQVWVSTATPDGRRLSAVALDKRSGRIVHDLTLFDVPNPQYAHPFNSYASPTPVIENGRVYVTFGSPGTAAIDTATGKVLWTRRDLECNHFRGAGSSPILFRHLLLMHFDGSDRQYVVALDKRTGKTVWQTNRSIDFQDVLPRAQVDGAADAVQLLALRLGERRRRMREYAGAVRHRLVEEDAEEVVAQVVVAPDVAATAAQCVGLAQAAHGVDGARPEVPRRTLAEDRLVLDHQGAEADQVTARPVAVDVRLAGTDVAAE